MKKSLSSEFLIISTPARIAGYKRKNDDIQEHDDSLLEVSTQKEKKLTRGKMIIAKLNI